MAKKSLTNPMHPDLWVYAQSQPFDNAFVAVDNPDDDVIQQFGNGETMVVHDNPDDVEDSFIIGG